MTRTNRLCTAAVLVALCGSTAFAAAASAQSSANASIIATALVQNGLAPLTANGVNNLNFGTVNAGTPQSPASAANDGGRWDISGEPSFPVTVSFGTLPTVLSGPGGATIPVTFGGTDGLLWTAFPTTSTTFNPNAPFATSTDGFGNLTIGLLGTVSPPLTAINGTYTATITLTVSY
jgi:hypothetical protein